MKRISIITMLVLAITLTANAQQRKRTAPARKATTAQSTANKSKANICIVNMKDISLEKPLAEDANYLYLLDQLDRSIIGIDKKTGDIQRNSDQLHFDQQGNLIMYGYDHLDIYNPDGVKGYTKLQNTVTRYKAE